MKQHNFHRTANTVNAYPTTAFRIHGCDSFATFQQVRPGALCELPPGYERLHPGFVAYRCDDGEVIGLAQD